MPPHRGAGRSPPGAATVGHLQRQRRGRCDRGADPAVGGTRDHGALTALMQSTEVAEEPTGRAAGARTGPIADYARMIPGLLVVALLLVWAVHDGGYDADTWYWGALLMLALLAGVVI